MRERERESERIEIEDRKEKMKKVKNTKMHLIDSTYSVQLARHCPHHSKIKTQ